MRASRSGARTSSAPRFRAQIKDSGAKDLNLKQYFTTKQYNSLWKHLEGKQVREGSPEAKKAWEALRISKVDKNKKKRRCSRLPSRIRANGSDTWSR